MNKKLQTRDAVQVKLEPYSENFRLRHIMECDIMKFRDEVEDICIGAKKEQEIDMKLKQAIQKKWRRWWNI